MAPKGKRGAEQDMPKPKRGRGSRQEEPLDPVAKQCHTVAEALRSADLPPVIKEVLVNVIPHSLAMRQDERHDFQEKMVQSIGKTLHSVEADLKKAAADAETEVKEMEAKVEELKQEQALAEEAAKATFELSLQKKKVLAQAATEFREAKQVLAKARQAEEEGSKELKKFALDSEALTLAMTRFEPLKNWTVEPANSKGETEQLMNSLKGRIELDETLSAALPTALASPISERSSFTTMVVHQFGDILKARIEDLEEKCRSEESSKATLAAALHTAEKALEVAAGHQMEAADAFITENDAYSAKTTAVQSQKKAARETRPLIRKRESLSAQLQVKMNTFQQGPLEAFEKLRSRQQEASDNAVAAPPESEATAISAHDAEADIATPVTTA
mmetsp:Transcript_15348/g.30203  ORF Transcript_15348/g.30203 Transcript_15348/m.30203 type:complete len:389 (-) Transcript_15348:106-1272(-)|eukprot:CAMPEP_0172727954 /NCGR_PEP_ID=MMETSP1074-20121228/91971_1 /TAXON_ID=2916 /ORGANISM="Ceratium fusus, Strain PA161109" /LENGTH=388 /DNA_ID=CAMNT_0013555155 /DNA_START=78 /DNA_END=1244 /DNA_ORIENTATION=-